MKNLENSICTHYHDAVTLAETAGSKGTFAVGGVLVNKRTGRIIKHMENSVVRDGIVYDPTAHVERQLIDWYFASKEEGIEIPEAGDCIIISSLDPCIMCGGSALTAGIEVATANLDPFVSVNWTGDMSFAALPSELTGKAAEIFSYLGVAAAPDFQGRAFQGNPHHPLRAAEIPYEIVLRSETAFMGSVQNVRDTINSGSFIEKAFVKAARPTAEHVVLLTNLAETALRSGNNFQAGMLISPSGEVLRAHGDNTGKSPILTPLMQVMRGYMKDRWDAIKSGDFNKPHPKTCTYLQLIGPGTDASDIADLGAFGSTIEGEIPHGHQPFLFVKPKIEAERLAGIIQNLPPFYRDVVKVNPQQLVL